MEQSAVGAAYNARSFAVPDSAAALGDNSWMGFLTIDKRDAVEALHMPAPASSISTATSSRRPSHPEMDLLPMIQPMFGPGIGMPPLERCHKRGWSMPALNLSACSSAPEMAHMQISPVSGRFAPCYAGSISTLSNHAASDVRSTRSSSRTYQPGAVMSTRSSSMCMSLVSSAGRPSSCSSPVSPLKMDKLDLPAPLRSNDPMLPVGLHGLDTPGQLSPKTPRQADGMLQMDLQLFQYHNIPSPPTRLIKEEEEDRRDMGGIRDMLPNIDLMKIASRTSSPISQSAIPPTAANGVQPPPMPPLPNWGNNSIMTSDALFNLPVPPVPTKLPHPATGRTTIPKTCLPRHVRTPKSRRRTRSSGNVLGGRKRRNRSRSAIPGLDPALVERVRKLAADHHLSQVDIMRGSGISNTILSDWLKHKYRGNLCEINERLRYYCDKMESYYSGREVMPAFLLKPNRSSRSRINLGELIPIEMDLDFGATQYQDFFLWDPDEIHITPKIFAEQACRDLRLSRNCVQIIEKELASQIEHGKKNLIIIRDILADNTKKGQTLAVKLPELEREIQWNLTDINTTPEEFGKMLQSMWSLTGKDALYIAHRIRMAVIEHFCPSENRPSLEARRRSARAVFNMLIAANQSGSPKG